MLDEMTDTAAQHSRDYPDIRKLEPVASEIIGGYYRGGRKLIMQVQSHLYLTLNETMAIHDERT